ncbi:lantibiotic dehydratase [Sphingobacterium lactis]|uniref:lantibiotic dehydratase n=1 Tax=Sphingobacterium lactis TaxID=797291 RepID=UPI003EC6BF57
MAYNFDKDKVGLFNEGLYLASPEYFNLYKKNKFEGVKNEKFRDTLIKYWLRSCVRCTPFGTFAGNGLIKIDEKKSNLILDNSSNFKRIARLDMNYLYSIIRKLEKIPEIRNKIKFFKNNSVYETFDAFRYPEFSIHNNQRKYSLVSIEKSDYISEVLNSANSGSTLFELSKILSEFTNSTFEDSYEFILQMWNSQLLISELEPCITGSDPFEILLKRLYEIKCDSIDLKKLSNVFYLLKNIKDINTYLEIENTLGKIFDFKTPKNTIQVDLFLSFKKNIIEKSVIDSLFNQLNKLANSYQKSKNPILDNFKTKFSQKFENREIPLNIALDAELGIGYSGLNNGTIAGNDLIDDIPHFSSNQDNTNFIEFNKIHKYVLYKYHEYLENNLEIIEIKESELLSNEKDKLPQTPFSMYLIGSFLKKDQKFNDIDFLFDLHGISGPSGANLLGRFAYGDEKLEEFSKLILKDEENDNPNIIFAEIAHVPEDRIGNILLRPSLRNFEIPYLGKSGSSFNNQIFIDDIMVSVVGNEVILRSLRFNKRIIPRLTTAHNFNSNKNLPIYKFLCDLQNQNMYYPIFWDWGILKNQKHLPRVVYKNIIVKKASWLVNIGDILRMDSVKSCDSDAVSLYIKNRKIPSSVLIKQNDNKLLVDFDTNEGIEIFIKFLKKYSQLELEEFLFNKDNCVVKDHLGNPFTNEVVIPFKNPTSKDDSDIIFKNENFINVNRKFSPGTEWLYFKMYCGSKISENILKGPILDFIERNLNKNGFERFFFIRYKDTEPHIRIRFYNSKKKLNEIVQRDFTKILQPYIDNNLIHSLVVDTYVQEIERYSDKFIEDSEKIFYNDSLAVLKIIKLLNGNENLKLFLAMRGIDQLLNDFQYDLIEKLKILKIISEQMFLIFGGHSSLRNKINSKYKNIQKEVFRYMNKENDESNDIQKYISIFNARTEMNSDIVSSIINRTSSADPRKVFNELIPSYLHMFINRFFISQQIKHELIIYMFLERYYTSQVVINSKGNKMKK